MNRWSHADSFLYIVNNQQSVFEVWLLVASAPDLLPEGSRSVHFVLWSFKCCFHHGRQNPLVSYRRHRLVSSGLDSTPPRGSRRGVALKAASADEPVLLQVSFFFLPGWPLCFVGRARKGY